MSLTFLEILQKHGKPELSLPKEPTDFGVIFDTYLFNILQYAPAQGFMEISFPNSTDGTTFNIRLQDVFEEAIKVKDAWTGEALHDINPTRLMAATVNGYSYFNLWTHENFNKHFIAATLHELTDLINRNDEPTEVINVMTAARLQRELLLAQSVIGEQVEALRLKEIHMHQVLTDNSMLQQYISSLGPTMQQPGSKKTSGQEQWYQQRIESLERRMHEMEQRILGYVAPAYKPRYAPVPPFVPGVNVNGFRGEGYYAPPLTEKPVAPSYGDGMYHFNNFGVQNHR